jgi:hypothetical protein
MGFTLGSSVGFNSTQTHTYRIKFASHDRARYFFNSGGQFSINLLQTIAPVSTAASNLGTIRFGAGPQTIAGIGYTGTTKVGGVMDAYSVVNTTKNFYNIGLTENLLATQGVAGSTASISLYIQYDGAGGFTFKTISSAPDTNPDITAGGTLFITQREPHTSACFLNTWGNAAYVSAVVTQTSVATEASELSIMNSWWFNRTNYVRTGLTPTSYPGDLRQWNSPHIRYYPSQLYPDVGGYYTVLFTYSTAINAAAIALAQLSRYYTVVTYVTGKLQPSGGTLTNPPDAIPVNTSGALQYPISTAGIFYTGDNVAQPNTNFIDGLGARISVYEGRLSDITSSYVTAQQGGSNHGSWPYQLMIPGKWGIAKQEIDFNTGSNRTLGPGRMALVLYERGVNRPGLQTLPTTEGMSYDAYWYNGGGMQILVNPNSYAVNVNLSAFNTGYTPRVYFELSKDGGAETPTTTTNPPPPEPPIDGGGEQQFA